MWLIILLSLSVLLNVFTCGLIARHVRWWNRFEQLHFRGYKGYDPDNFFKDKE